MISKFNPFIPFQMTEYYKPRNYSRGIAYHTKRKELVVCLNSADAAKTRTDLDTGNTIVSYCMDNDTPKLRNAPESTRVYLVHPCRVQCSPVSGDIFVSDSARKCIVVMDENMVFKFEIPCDNFSVRNNYIPAFAIDKHDRIVLYDDRSSLLRVLRPDGTNQQKFDLGVQTDCSLSMVEIDSNNSLWISHERQISIFHINL